ncbi:MAG: hypothetical protein GPJ51_05435 [Candidatus Heimdallarchaeota archaeon]|nr:hypothetical protein [Candidatus Heimdallarchaeota archaeon]
MQCNMKCPKCKETHEINSQFCAHCGFDLEPYIIRFKDKHLPIHFDGGIIDAIVGEEEEEDFCDCCGGCCCGGGSSKKKSSGFCDCLLDCL